MAPKLGLGLLLSHSVVLVGFGYVDWRSARAEREELSEREAEAVGSLLRLRLEETWRDRGLEEARRALRELPAGDPNLSVDWVDDPEGLGLSERDRLAQGGSVFVREGGELHLYVPVRPGEGALGVIDVVAPLGDAQATRGSLWRLLSALACSLLVSWVLVVWLGQRLVGRPVHVLLRRLRALGGGDLEQRLGLSQHDELGQLGDELDRVSAELGEAQRRAGEEQRQREEAEHQLRHAERLVTVGRLGAGIAHELGTPLNVVLARARRLEREAPNATFERDAGEICEQVQRMSGIIRQLLDFARRGAPRRVLHDLRDTLERGTQVLAPLARKSGVEIRVEQRGEPAWVDANPEQLQQVLANLVMNSIQASSSGDSVLLGLLEARGSDPAQPDEDVECWVLQVIDRGEGIEPEALSRLFEPFYTTKDVGMGTGLGLSVVHGIVADHGGWLRVRSQPGEGSEFSVWLPKGAPHELSDRADRR